MPPACPAGRALQQQLRVAPAPAKLPWQPLFTDEEVRRGMLYGSGLRLQRLARKLMAGQPIKVRLGGRGRWHDGGLSYRGGKGRGPYTYARPCVYVCVCGVRVYGPSHSPRQGSGAWARRRLLHGPAGPALGRPPCRQTSAGPLALPAPQVVFLGGSVTNAADLEAQGLSYTARFEAFIRSAFPNR